jgi:hypothetical protein
VVRNCNVACNGKEVLIPQYEVLVVSHLGTEIATAPLSAVAANPKRAEPARSGTPMNRRRPRRRAASSIALPSRSPINDNPPGRRGR